MRRGILREHLHVRAAAGLFDVSHMGQFAVRARSGRGEDAASALESVVPMDLIGLAAGRQRYALLTNDAGGIRDDLMIANQGDRFLIVANAACKDADEAHLRQMLSAQCEIERLDGRALLALQGPLAEMALAPLVPEVTVMRFMDVRAVTLLGADCVISRSGYTGEDGFEISVPAALAEPLARKLLADARVEMIGLGARDSLRLEAGLCLYGARSGRNDHAGRGGARMEHSGEPPQRRQPRRRLSRRRHRARPARTWRAAAAGRPAA